MKAWGLSESDIRAAAQSVGLRIHGWPHGDITPDGRALRFRLALDTSQTRRDDGSLPFQRVSTNAWRRHESERPRRVNAVCWHGHREFMRAAFRVNPDARIKTALADYRGSDDFERTHRETFGSGNEWNLAYGSACSCPSDESEHEVTFGTLTPDRGLVDVRTIRQSDIGACPFVIFVPEHYRADGSCRCDDPEHRRTMIEEWGYAESDFAGIPARVA